MSQPNTRYAHHRYPREIIAHKAWLYHRFALSFRDVEDLPAQRGVEVSYETIRRWCIKFGPGYAARTRKRQPQLGDNWYLDEIVIPLRDSCASC